MERAGRRERSLTEVKGGGAAALNTAHPPQPQRHDRSDMPDSSLDLRASAYLILPVLACWLLAAHFLRDDQLVLTAACVLLPLLLAVPRAWAARTLQVLLAVGALEWLRTLAAIAAQRIAMDQPYLRLTVILLGVALFTAAAALVFRNARLRARYRLG